MAQPTSNITPQHLAPNTTPRTTPPGGPAPGARNTRPQPQQRRAQQGQQGGQGRSKRDPKRSAAKAVGAPAGAHRGAPSAGCTIRVSSSTTGTIINSQAGPYQASQQPAGPAAAAAPVSAGHPAGCPPLVPLWRACGGGAHRAGCGRHASVCQRSSGGSGSWGPGGAGGAAGCRAAGCGRPGCAGGARVCGVGPKQVGSLGDTSVVGGRYSREKRRFEGKPRAARRSHMDLCT